MKDQNRKQILDIFSKKLQQNFEYYCDLHYQNVNLENFVTYIIDQELISPDTIKHYTILEVFDELFTNTDNPKTQVVNTLAARFNLTPRSIWNLLRKHQSTLKSGNRAKK